MFVFCVGQKSRLSCACDHLNFIISDVRWETGPIAWSYSMSDWDGARDSLFVGDVQDSPGQQCATWRILRTEGREKYFQVKNILYKTGSDASLLRVVIGSTHITWPSPSLPLADRNERQIFESDTKAGDALQCSGNKAEWSNCFWRIIEWSWFIRTGDITTSGGAPPSPASPLCWPAREQWLRMVTVLSAPTLSSFSNPIKKWHLCSPRNEVHISIFAISEVILLTSWLEMSRELGSVSSWAGVRMMQCNLRCSNSVYLSVRIATFIKMKLRAPDCKSHLLSPDRAWSLTPVNIDCTLFTQHLNSFHPSHSPAGPCV